MFLTGLVSGVVQANTTQPRQVPNVVMQDKKGDTTFAETLAHEDCLPMPTRKMLFVVESTKKESGSKGGLGAFQCDKAGESMQEQSIKTVETKTLDSNVTDTEGVKKTTVGIVCLTGAMTVEQSVQSIRTQAFCQYLSVKSGV